jgi:glyoxylase-like metal-dependent hydrolase (beta-lactamase superfamily II)
MSELKAAIVPVTPFQQNCAIIWNDATKRAAVIDPGGDVNRLLEAIGKIGARVEKIVLTHGHIDHAGGAAALKEALEAAGVEGT